MDFVPTEAYHKYKISLYSKLLLKARRLIAQPPQ